MIACKGRFDDFKAVYPPRGGGAYRAEPDSGRIGQFSEMGHKVKGEGLVRRRSI